MSFVHSKQIGACSCTGWRGFNGISWGAMWDKYFRLPEERTVEFTTLVEM